MGNEQFFKNILGHHNLKQGLSICNTFDPSKFSLDNTFISLKFLPQYTYIIEIMLSWCSCLPPKNHKKNPNFSRYTNYYNVLFTFSVYILSSHFQVGCI